MTRSHIYLFIFLFLLATSCTHKSSIVPKDPTEQKNDSVMLNTDSVNVTGDFEGLRVYKTNCYGTLSVDTTYDSIEIRWIDSQTVTIDKFNIPSYPFNGLHSLKKGIETDSSIGYSKIMPTIVLTYNKYDESIFVSGGYGQSGCGYDLQFWGDKAQ